MDSLVSQILTLFTEDKYYTKEKKEKIKNLIEGFIDNVKKLDNDSISFESLQKKTSSLSGLGEKTKQIRGHSLIKEAEEIKRCIMELANSKIRVSLKDSLILNLAVNLEQIFHKQLWNTRTAKKSFASIGTLVLSSIIPSEEEEEEEEMETEEEESASYNEKEKGPNEKDLLLEENDKLKSKVRELEEDSDLEKVKKLSSNSDVKSKQKVWYYMKYKCDSLRTEIPTEEYESCGLWDLDMSAPSFYEDIQFVGDKLGHIFFISSLYSDQGSINEQGSSQSSQSSQSSLPPVLHTGCSISSSRMKGTLGPVSQSEDSYYGISSGHLFSGRNDKVYFHGAENKTEIGIVNHYSQEPDFMSFKIKQDSMGTLKTTLDTFNTISELSEALKGASSLIRHSKEDELTLQVNENIKVMVLKKDFGSGVNPYVTISIPFQNEFVTKDGCSGELITKDSYFLGIHKGVVPNLKAMEESANAEQDEAQKNQKTILLEKFVQGIYPILLISVPGVVIQNQLSGHKFYKLKKPTPLMN